MADLLECPGCQTQIIIGFGLGPFAEHFQPDYAVKRAHERPLCRVDDC